MPASTSVDYKGIELLSTVGFNGKVLGGLLLHPKDNCIIYPLGNTVVGKNLETHKQFFLTGHTDNVSCVTVSRDGALLASGQETHMGFKAPVIIWDFDSKREYCRLINHKVKVEALSFSPNRMYLATLGGQDDGNVVIWNIEEKKAICGSPAAVLSAGITNCVAFSNNSDEIFATGGDKTLRVWSLDVKNTKIKPIEVNVGQTIREVHCLKFTDDDKFLFCGTKTGDVLKVNTETCLLITLGPENTKVNSKNLYSQGVRSLYILNDNELLLGAGDGTVGKLNVEGKDRFKKLESKKIDGMVTSFAIKRAKGNRTPEKFYVGTDKCQIYEFQIAVEKATKDTKEKSIFKCDVLETCHYSEITDIAFAAGESTLLITCAKHEIRVWNNMTGKELLRIRVDGKICNGVDITNDGQCIVSGWNDGVIRAYTPESGKLMWEQDNAHNKGVTALVCRNDSTSFLSGGGEGKLRLWEVERFVKNPQIRMTEMKEHTAEITCIKVKRDDTECVTASFDGSCIVWDLMATPPVRRSVVFANTHFMSVCYSRDESQILTTGSDRKIAYWDVHDGNAIRDIEGSKSSDLNGLDISPIDGDHFVTGGEDKLVKLWKYEEGVVTHMAAGHSADITNIRICPREQFIVSVSKDGAILRWKYPVEYDPYSDPED